MITIFWQTAISLYKTCFTPKFLSNSFYGWTESSSYLNVLIIVEIFSTNKKLSQMDEQGPFLYFQHSWVKKEKLLEF